MPFMPLRMSFIISPKGFILPFASVMLMPNAFMAVPDSFVGLAIRVMVERNDVPAWVPLIPLLAIRPVATAKSSTEYPMAPAAAPAYLKVSPIISTLVFALAEAAAITSAKRPLSAAVCPKAVRASVTMSDVVARSAPEAAARFMIPLMPLVMSSAFQPAMAMYSMALAASVAENCVVAPISFALLRSISKSCPVAPEIAATEDIADSKLMPASTTPLAMPLMLPVTAFTALLPISDMTPKAKPPLIFVATSCREVIS